MSGQVLRRDDSRPYPRAWIRFSWLLNAVYEREVHTMTDANGRYSIALPPGRYQVTAGDDCELNAGFAIVGRVADDVMISVPDTNRVDLVEYDITPGAHIEGLC